MTHKNSDKMLKMFLIRKDGENLITALVKQITDHNSHKILQKWMLFISTKHLLFIWQNPEVKKKLTEVLKEVSKGKRHFLQYYF